MSPFGIFLRVQERHSSVVPGRAAAQITGEVNIMARKATMGANMTAGRMTAQERNSREESDHSRGRGWHGDPEGHAAAGRKGGRKVSQDRQHMAEIGRRGGSKVAQDRQHMAEI